LLDSLLQEIFVALEDILPFSSVNTGALCYAKYKNLNPALGYTGCEVT